MEQKMALELAFEQDGDDLIVSTTVKANNSSHVLWTHVLVTSTMGEGEERAEKKRERY